MGQVGVMAKKRDKKPASAGRKTSRGGAKTRPIGKYLGRGYSVKATIGHLRDLPTRKRGVEIDDKGRTFQPEYVTIKGKTTTLSETKKAAKEAKEVLLATYPDREGEAIAWHVATQIGNGVP